MLIQGGYPRDINRYLSRYCHTRSKEKRCKREILTNLTLFHLTFSLVMAMNQMVNQSQSSPNDAPPSPQQGRRSTNPARAPVNTAVRVALLLRSWKRQQFSAKWHRLVHNAHDKSNDPIKSREPDANALAVMVMLDLLKEGRSNTEAKAKNCARYHVISK